MSSERFGIIIVIEYVSTVSGDVSVCWLACAENGVRGEWDYIKRQTNRRHSLRHPRRRRTFNQQRITSTIA